MAAFGRSSVSAEKRPLKMPLVRGERVGWRGEDLLKMAERLEERHRLLAEGRGVFPQQKAAHDLLPLPATADDPVRRLQRKGERENFCGGLDRRPAEQFQQQRPEQRSVEGMARQHAREEQRERFPAATPLAAIRTKHPLTPGDLAIDRRRIVTPQYAVAVQRTPCAAMRTAPPLERKSTALNSSSSRTNSIGVERIVRLPARRPGGARGISPDGTPQPRGSVPKGSR